MRRIALLSLALVALGACAAPRAGSTAAYGRGEPAPARAVRAAAVRPERSTRSTAAVAQFVRTHQGQLQFCQDDARLRGTSASGTATVEVTLAEDGYVLRARVTERAWSADGRDMEDCLLTTVRRWVFPSSGTMDTYVHAFTVDFAPDAPRPRTASR